MYSSVFEFSYLSRTPMRIDMNLMIRLALDLINIFSNHWTSSKNAAAKLIIGGKDRFVVSTFFWIES